MSEWITDRQPTEADADPDGEVRVRKSPTSDDYKYLHRSYVGPGVPWRHSTQWGPPAPAAEPTPLPVPAPKIPEPIRNGAAQFYVVVVSDDSGRGSGGNPIIWETPVPDGSTLQAVLRQRDRIGSRYGTTHIAECRIIPELTREVPADA